EADEFGPDVRGQAGGLLVGVRDEQRLPAGEGVGQPRPGGGGFGLLQGAAVQQTATLVVLREHGLIAFTQAAGPPVLPPGGGSGGRARRPGRAGAPPCTLGRTRGWGGRSAPTATAARRTWRSTAGPGRLADRRTGGVRRAAPLGSTCSASAATSPPSPAATSP